MVNITDALNGSLLNQTYDLLKIVSDDAIDHPTRWLYNVNTELTGIVIVTFLAIFALILFLTCRQLLNVADSEAAVYAGLITVFISIFIFVIDVFGYPDAKLLEWYHLTIFIVLTALAILVNIWARRW